MTTNWTKFALLGVALLVVAGCSGGPSAIKAPSISPSKAAAAAIEQYDANGDGVISGDELQKTPGMLWLLSEIDKDGDQGISAEELESRIQFWQETQAALAPTSLTIIYRKKPLQNAKVVLEPEAFLGSNLKPAEGITDYAGQVRFRIPDQPEKLPGVAPGFYKVKITSDAVSIPAQYNDETTLGLEVTGKKLLPEQRSNEIKIK